VNELKRTRVAYANQQTIEEIVYETRATGTIEIFTFAT